MGIDHYGASAAGDRLFKEFGFTVDHVVAAAKESIAAAPRLSPIDGKDAVYFL